MTSPLKPVSQALRDALSLLGETPAEHQQSILNKARSKDNTWLREQEKKGRLLLNAKVLKGQALLPASEIVDQWKAQIEWRADARVLFVREQTCQCGAKTVCLHWPEVFLRLRKQRKDQLKTYRYKPARSAITREYNLPLQRVSVPVEVSYCQECVQVDALPLEEPVCLSDILLSQPAGTGSSERPSQISGTSSEGISSSKSPPTSIVSSPTTRDGSEALRVYFNRQPMPLPVPYSASGFHLLGYDFDETPDVRLALVQHSLTPTSEADHATE